MTRAPTRAKKLRLEPQARAQLAPTPYHPANPLTDLREGEDVAQQEVGHPLEVLHAVHAAVPKVHALQRALVVEEDVLPAVPGHVRVLVAELLVPAHLLGPLVGVRAQTLREFQRGHAVTGAVVVVTVKDLKNVVNDILEQDSGQVRGAARAQPNNLGSGFYSCVVFIFIFNFFLTVSLNNIKSNLTNF